ncbi:MAG: 2-oxo acid dehydrogenase subunit E2 [Bacillota bacterium]
MSDYNIREFPSSRIATIDVCAIGKQKHHMCVLLECDVTESRQKLRALKSSGCKVSFNSWLVKVIANTLKEHSEASAFLYGKKRIIIFEDINISLLVEKKLAGMKVPIPIVLEKTHTKSISEITKEIEVAKDEELSGNSIVINRKTSLSESLYYYLPGFLRRRIWKILLRYPRTIYKKMGNVAVTFVGMYGQIKGWFIHTTIHPVSFGIGSVVKKPAVINNGIKIREILNMTVLIDHDVIDGVPMAKFINNLVRSIENGSELPDTCDY